ncbi:uncharacterized protein PgNI_00203 [Pyricularia grisea]|uniref:Calcineurin-like phosphoesterase domain-containing protein n=1 Tax=Pyricularia grisea TaxID=148305 RepID=A0A6P8BGW7_PYRGI|nr:uncharacterized protein PgNI_00203 [Pyricularia grisea]TLD16111.1 hypothetical protein PgNI_00203 [Pyricularia grisea]
MPAKSTIKTRILILSDTHGMKLASKVPSTTSVDVLIHCGDLTEHSRLEEYHASSHLLQSIDAPLKLAIAGNHDLTLDWPAFSAKIAEAKLDLDSEQVINSFGREGDARRILESGGGVRLLYQGRHAFTLANGALLTIYASPCTPSDGGGAYQYRRDDGHDFDVGDGGGAVDVFVTHGPPRGVLDRTSGRERAGCADLFAAVARARPRLHCFGHIHEGWGGKLVAWREKLAETPSFFTDIDNERSVVVETLATLADGKFDDLETSTQKAKRREMYAKEKSCRISCCSGDQHPLVAGKHTLFVNAAIQDDNGGGEAAAQLPWVVDIELPEDIMEEGKVGMETNQVSGFKTRRLSGAEDACKMPAAKRRKG